MEANTLKSVVPLIIAWIFIILFLLLFKNKRQKFKTYFKAHVQSETISKPFAFSGFFLFQH